VIWAPLALIVVVAFLAFQVRRAYRNGGMDVIGGRVKPLTVVLAAIIIAVAWGIMAAIQIGFIPDSAP